MTSSVESDLPFTSCSGRRLRRNEQIQRHNPLYRQVSVTSSASDDEHCISAYSEPVLVRMRVLI